MSVVPRLAVVGCHGYGARHVLQAVAMQRRGEVRLVGLVDPVVAPVVRGDVVLGLDELPPFSPDLPSLLRDVAVDVVVVATPLHLHAEQACAALAAGADVLLEKPPVTGRAELHELLAAEAASTGRVQVGFQALGSQALAVLAEGVREGALGRVVSLGAWGSWSRDRSYYARAPWAGRRRLGGRDVLDGALTNPFAHALADLLHLAGRTAAVDVPVVELELHRAHDIEADDTSAVRLPGSSRGVVDCPVVGAFTLAGPREDEPVIEVRGTRGTAHLLYARDRLEIDGDGRAARMAGTYPRHDLLVDLLRSRRGGGPLMSPLAATAGFVEIVEAVRRVEPVSLPAHVVRWTGTGASARPVVDGVAGAVRSAATTGRLFNEVGVAWGR